MVAIKLGVSENGLAPAFYRRISFDAIGETEITQLKQQAVLLFQGHENGDASTVDLQNFAVTLFYVDADGDKVLIATKQDLLEAMEENGHVRAAIKVHATVTLPAATKATQTNPETVVDAFADLIQSVAVTAQAGVQAAATQAKQAHREQLLQSKKVQKAQANLQKAVSKEQCKAVKRHSKEQYKAMKSAASTSKEALQKTMQEARAPQKSVVEADRAKEPETLFIHGRHTCDLCLTSPIIGKRFHATNLPDYDMCGTCHENYKGSDIVFTEMVLDRDVSMQDRWARKYHRMVQINKCRPRAGQFGPGRRFGPSHHGRPHGPHHGRPHGPPPGHPHGPPHHRPPFGGPPCGPPPPFAPPPPAGPYVNPRQESSWDAALAEAVRRSLEDENKAKEAPVSRSHSEEKPMSHSEEKPAIAMSHSSDDSAKVAAALGKVAADAAQAFSRFLEDVPRSSTTETASMSSSDSSSKKVASVQVETVQDDEEPNKEEAQVETVQEEPQVEEAKEKEVAVEEVVEETAVEEVVEETNEAAAEEEKEIVEEVEVVSDPAEVNDAAPTESVEEKARAPSDSFSSDALDSGSVAAFMGETLDRFSEAIDSLNSEMNGATIVDGENDIEDDDSSKDSWSVVEDEQISHDENLARAAVMIGSALFNSDNNVAASQASAQASQVSSITSAPSEVPSMLTRVSQAQMDRWSVQLKQFHEMGLDDDAKYVEVMEMLAAANIGSGQDDEITVEQVLDHAM